MESKYTQEETNTMVELSFVDLIRRNALESTQIADFTLKLLKLYLDNVDTSVNNDTSVDNDKFRYEIRKDLLFYFIQDNNLEKIEMIDGYLDGYVYYYVFDLLHSTNKPLNLSDSITKFLNIKMKGDTLQYIRGKLYDDIYYNKSCLSEIYHYK